MMGHPFSKFEKYIDTPLQPFIIPIVPARNADGTPTTLRASSNLKPENLGKIPGLWYPDGWTGFGGWQNHRTKATTLKAWQAWQDKTKTAIPVGFITADVHACDIDCDKQEIVDAHVALFNEHLGTSMVVRCRHKSTRCVLFYKHEDHTAPIRKYRVAFIDKEGMKHAVEFLAGGQQVVIEGPHAKGEMHYWQNVIGLLEGYDELPVINIEMVNAWHAAARQWVVDQGFTLDKASTPSQSDHAAAVSISNLMSPHAVRGGDTSMLVKAIAAIDINDPRLDYDTWCALFRAMWAACAGDRQFYDEHILPWLLKHPENKEEDMETKLASFTSSQLGAEYVYGIAASYFGFTEAINDLTSTRTKNIFDGYTDGAADDGDAQAAVGGGSPGAPGSIVPPSGGPTAFPYTDMALADRVAAEHPELRYTPDQGWVKLESGVYVPTKVVLRPIAEVCAAVGAPYRAQGAQQAMLDVTLNGHKKHAAVEMTLRHHPAVFAAPEDFDAEPWLLNTPGGIIDLRDGRSMSHGMLMRSQTAFSPDWAAYNAYEIACPQWWNYLQFISAGRDWVIPLLQRWGASSLIGAIYGAYFLFIHGKPGTGKTVYLDVLSRLAHLYGHPVSKNFFMRSLEKRTFELYQTFGKRAVFSDEVPKGTTWDEMMLLAMLNGSELSAEGKGKDFRKWRSCATITITGNHKPAFVTSAEESGIDRRLLLLEVNKKIAEHMPDNERFAEEVVRDEGPAIMMFFVQGAIEGWGQLERTGSFMGDLVKEALEGARDYRKASNPFLQWINEDMEEGRGEGFDYEAKVAFKDFVTYMREQNPKYHCSKEDFRSGMEALGFPYGRRTLGRIGIGRMVFKGIRPRQDDGSVTLPPDVFGNGGSKVVQFPTTEKKEK